MRFNSICEVREYLEKILLDWTPDEIFSIADTIRAHAKKAGLGFGQDWSRSIEAVLNTLKG